MLMSSMLCSRLLPVAMLPGRRNIASLHLWLLMIAIVPSCRSGVGQTNTSRLPMGYRVRMLMRVIYMLIKRFTEFIKIPRQNLELMFVNVFGLSQGTRELCHLLSEVAKVRVNRVEPR